LGRGWGHGSRLGSGWVPAGARAAAGRRRIDRNRISGPLAAKHRIHRLRRASPQDHRCRLRGSPGREDLRRALSSSGRSTPGALASALCAIRSKDAEDLEDWEDSTEPKLNRLRVFNAASGFESLSLRYLKSITYGTGLGSRVQSGQARCLSPQFPPVDETPSGTWLRSAVRWHVAVCCRCRRTTTGSVSRSIARYTGTAAIPPKPHRQRQVQPLSEPTRVSCFTFFFKLLFPGWIGI
jgi:hypothetical protein